MMAEVRHKVEHFLLGTSLHPEMEKFAEQEKAFAEVDILHKAVLLPLLDADTVEWAGKALVGSLVDSNVLADNLWLLLEDVDHHSAVDDYYCTNFAGVHASFVVVFSLLLVVISFLLS